ncbi:hypothetical protein GA0115253_1098852 [Streptomyces sp. Termitarium-T10T-6]|nr:hypothetical protein GA0115253_1098852 [Streptomyces sp. Termitarium-T10T-6]
MPPEGRGKTFGKREVGQEVRSVIVNAREIRQDGQNRGARHNGKEREGGQGRHHGQSGGPA